MVWCGEQWTNQTHSKIEFHSQVIQLSTREVMGYMLEATHTVTFSLAPPTGTDACCLVDLVLMSLQYAPKLGCF